MTRHLRETLIGGAMGAISGVALGFLAGGVVVACDEQPAMTKHELIEEIDTQDAIRGKFLRIRDETEARVGEACLSFIAPYREDNLSSADLEQFLDDATAAVDAPCGSKTEAGATFSELATADADIRRQTEVTQMLRLDLETGHYAPDSQDFSPMHVMPASTGLLLGVVGAVTRRYTLRLADQQRQVAST